MKVEMSAPLSCLNTGKNGNRTRTRVPGSLSLPAAPAMCSSMLSRSSQAAGWMSPYISSVRMGAALISRDKGAGDRLITWERQKAWLKIFEDTGGYTPHETQVPLLLSLFSLCFIFIYFFDSILFSFNV